MTQPPQPPTLAYQPQSVPPHPPEWTNVRMYGLLAEGIPLFIRQRVINTIMLRLGISLFFAIVCIILFRNQPRLAAFFLIIYAIAQILSIAVACWRITVNARREWPTLRIFLSDQGMLRTLTNYPDVIILNHQIKQIHETRNTIVIRSIKKPIYIAIPACMENYAGIRAHLANLQPIASSLRTNVRIVQNLTVALVLFSAAFVAYFFGLYSHKLPVELGALAVVTPIWIWAFVRRMQNPNLRLSYKLTGLIFLAMPLFLLIKILLIHVVHR